MTTKGEQNRGVQKCKMYFLNFCSVSVCCFANPLFRFGSVAFMY